MNRRQFLAAGSMIPVLGTAPTLSAEWQPSQRYPDPLVRTIDASFS